MPEVIIFWKILFIHERHRERGRDTGRGRSRFPRGSLLWDSIPGPWDHDLSQRQMFNHWATQAPKHLKLLKQDAAAGKTELIITFVDQVGSEFQCRQWLSYVLFFVRLQHCIPLTGIKAYVILSTPPANLELCIPYLQVNSISTCQIISWLLLPLVSWLALIMIEYFYSYKNWKDGKIFSAHLQRLWALA